MLDPLLVDAENADIGGMMMAAGVDAARNLELELAQLLLPIDIGEALCDLLRNGDRARIGEAAIIPNSDLTSSKKVNVSSTEEVPVLSSTIGAADISAPRSTIVPGNIGLTTIEELQPVAECTRGSLESTERSSESTRGSSTTGNEIAQALAQQTSFNTAMSMGRNPSMIFQGELHRNPDP